MRVEQKAQPQEQTKKQCGYCGSSCLVYCLSVAHARLYWAKIYSVSVV